MNRTGHLNSKTFKKRILQAAIVIVLATGWIISFAGSARQVYDRRLEQETASAFAPEGGKVIESSNPSARGFQAVQANAAGPHQRNVLLSPFSKLGTALALFALVVPISLSVLSILFVRGVPTRLVPQNLSILFRLRLHEHAAVFRRKPVSAA